MSNGELRSSIIFRQLPRSSPKDSRKSLIPNNCFLNKKRIGTKKILTLLAEAAIKTSAKKMYDFYFKTMISISLFMSYNVTTFAINNLITAKSVVFEKPFQ